MLENSNTCMMADASNGFGQMIKSFSKKRFPFKKRSHLNKMNRNRLQSINRNDVCLDSETSNIDFNYTLKSLAIKGYGLWENYLNKKNKQIAKKENVNNSSQTKDLTVKKEAEQKVETKSVKPIQIEQVKESTIKENIINNDNNDQLSDKEIDRMEKRRLRERGYVVKRDNGDFYGADSTNANVVKGTILGMSPLVSSLVGVTVLAVLTISYFTFFKKK